MRKRIIEKPDIEIKKLEENGKISEMVIKKVVRSSRTSGYLILPKSLIGEYVTVTYTKEEK